MIKKRTQKLTLYEPATYQIKVPGHIAESWTDWVEGMKITVNSEADGLPLTTLTGILDQAGLQGLLRRLYSVGLPLISVNWVDGEPDDRGER